MTDTKFFDGVADVFSLDYEGRGVARVNGKTVFIKGALPTEKISFRVLKEKKQFSEAETVEVLKESNERVRPVCGYYETCGGCSLQHASLAAQVALKQRILEEQLERIGRVMPEQILPPIYGSSWHYRDRARLSVSVDKKGRLKMGFQAKKTNEVVDIEACHVLPQHISGVLPVVKLLLQTLSDGGAAVRFVEFFNSRELAVLNICFIKKPSSHSLKQIEEWFDRILGGAKRVWQIWVQYGREPSSALYPKDLPELKYSLPEFSVEMPYQPGDFTQINAELNAVMINRALRLLDIQPNDRVADLFCGLGNFSLPMAKSGALVIGIEGLDSLVLRAKQNALRNSCVKYVSFKAADLFDTDEKTVASWGVFDKMLLDPPRSGAYAVVKSLHAPYLPKRIVYVSCNPSTFARDAEVLVNKGYSFKSAGIMNMFAQTSHVESIGVFEL